MVEKKRFASHQILISISKDNQIKIFQKKIGEKDFFFEKNFEKIITFNIIYQSIYNAVDERSCENSVNKIGFI